VEISRLDLARLTIGKGVANTAIRWLPFFLPTLALAFSAQTSTLALWLGLAEAAGLATFFAGRWLDAGHERLVIMVALVTVAVSSLVALVGTVEAFAACVVGLGGAAGFVTVGGHAWISARVPFSRRARFIGIYETSWASALLVGAPSIAALIKVFGWRGPFIAVALAAGAAALMISTIDDRQDAPDDSPSKSESLNRGPLGFDALIIIAIAASVAISGLTTIVVVGTWLDEVLGVSTGGVGMVAMAFGLAELVASSMSAGFADRFGIRRTVQISTLTTLAGLSAISLTGTSMVVAVLGLCLFFVGFEYSIVTSFSLVSEAMPEARGRIIGIGSATATLTRGIGVGSAGLLYEQHGIHGPVALSALAIATAFVLLGVLRRIRPDIR